MNLIDRWGALRYTIFICAFQALQNIEWICVFPASMQCEPCSQSTASFTKPFWPSIVNRVIVTREFRISTTSTAPIRHPN